MSILIILTISIEFLTSHREKLALRNKIAYHAKCFCGNIQVNFLYDSMMHFRCRYLDCQVLWGGSFSRLAFTEQELGIKGNVTSHTYGGGSGLSLHLHFCLGCGTEIYSKPDILDVVVHVPAGLLHNQIDYMQKNEIWAKVKPKSTGTPDSRVQSY